MQRRLRLWRPPPAGTRATVTVSSPGATPGSGRVESCECPRGMLAHERLGVVERAGENVHVLLPADVPEHHGRVALETPKLRAFHRRALEGRGELLLRRRQQVTRELTRIPAREELPRRELGYLELAGETSIPGTAGLGRISVHPF